MAFRQVYSFWLSSGFRCPSRKWAKGVSVYIKPEELASFTLSLSSSACATFPKLAKAEFTVDFAIAFVTRKTRRHISQGHFWRCTFSGYCALWKLGRLNLKSRSTCWELDRTRESQTKIEKSMRLWVIIGKISESWWSPSDFARPMLQRLNLEIQGKLVSPSDFTRPMLQRL